ncbi:MAG: prephenate dehydratase, partial [Rhodothermia bacterium]|nr:prephenate dehydratase [Rhodothermia bacterium]
GEIGAFSEEAARILFPEDEPRPYPSFEAVFNAVHYGEAERGVVPIENSLHGSVHSNYDLLEEHELRITAEVSLRIRHALLGHPNVQLDQIKTVKSHPQALGQCRQFLKEKLRAVEIVPTYDTAGAARDVADAADPSVAAIASSRAGAEYGLVTIAEGIESNHQNYTRFLALATPGTMPEVPRGQKSTWKTSIVYAMKNNVPGALFKSLAVFALREIDLYKIESRPLVGSPGQYLFYLDLGGSEQEEGVTNAVGHLKEIAAYVKVLGSYPSGDVVD